MPNSHEKTDRQKIRVETKSHHILAIRGEIRPYQDIVRYDSEDTDDRWLLSGARATER
jgi:hypothetical protein